MVDRQWVELRALVQAALDADRVVARPPRTEQEWGFLAGTLTDHVHAKVKAAVDEGLR